MIRSITITLDGIQYMVEIDIKTRSADIVYHVLTPQHFRNDLPETFDIVQHENADQPQYEDKAFSEKGRQIAQAVWQQVRTLPPQFKGSKGQSQV